MGVLDNFIVISTGFAQSSRLASVTYVHAREVPFHVLENRLSATISAVSYPIIFTKKMSIFLDIIAVMSVVREFTYFIVNCLEVNFYEHFRSPIDIR